MRIKGAVSSASSYWVLFRRFCHGSPTSPLSSPGPGPLEMYKRLVRQGKLQNDVHQERVATELDDLLARLHKYERDMEDYHAKMARWEESRESERRRLLLEEAESKQKGGVWIKGKNRNENGFLGKWMSRRRGLMEPGVGKMVSYLNREKKLDNMVGKKPILPIAPKGIYLYGNVGSGKTMLMDMFYGATPGIVQHRRRFHFHEAMLEIHEHMHGVWKKEREAEEEATSENWGGGFGWIASLPLDAKVKEWLIGEEKYNQEVHRKHILSAVADKFLIDRLSNTCGASLLCFDEIQTVDVFAIVALSGILSRLMSTGTVLVATSNRAPEELNQDGMQREIFLDFLAKLEENCKKVPVGSDTDYRRLIPNDKADQIHYFWPPNSTNRANFDLAWREVCRKAGACVTSTVLPVMFGRSLEVAESCNGSARFDFEYLCGRPVGAAESEVASDPAISVSEPDKSPAHSSIASPTHGESPISPLVKPNSTEVRTTGIVDSAVTADPATLSNSNSVVSPVESGPSWDYFDSGVNQVKGLKQGKEKGGLSQIGEKGAVSVTEEVKGADLEEEVEREDESEFITHRAKEFVPSIKVIEQRFIRAAEAGDEVARMLETGKVRLSVSSVVLSGTPSASSLILAFNQFCCKRGTLLNQNYPKNAPKVITWNRSVSSISSSSKDHLACVPKEDSGEIGQDFIDQCAMISGSHSSTLERLYAWEKKLYDEIKASECIRRAYDHKCAILRHQFARDMKAQAIDKTRAAIKDLHSRLTVAIQAVNSISKRIEKMRDEELQPQLVELIHGIIRMWKAMLECHHAQFITISLAYHARRSTAQSQVENQNQFLTHLLEELDSFASAFTNWITSQKSYIQSLDSWLQKCVLQPTERRRGRRKAIFPPPQALSPPIFVLCRDWLAGLKSLPLDELLESVESVSSVLRDVFEQRKEDCSENGDDVKVKGMERFQSVLRGFFDRLNKFSEVSLKMCEEVKNSHEVARVAYTVESGNVPLASSRVSL